MIETTMAARFFKRILNWGTPVFFLAPVFAAFSLWMSIQWPRATHSALHTETIPGAVLWVSGFLILFAHFSYTRVHSAKFFYLLYLLSAHLALHSLATGSLLGIELNPEMVPFSHILLQGFVLCCFALSDKMTYSSTKKSTVLLVVLFTASFFYFALQSQSMDWVTSLKNGTLAGNADLWLLLPLFLAIIFGLYSLAENFYLGGFIAGLMVSGLFFWYGPNYLEDHRSFQSFHLLGTAGYSVSSVLIHWLYKVSHNITYDPLMNIFNRSHCNKIIEGQSGVKISPPFCVAMVDIDHFKKVNDTHGHQAGDTVLHHVAQTIKKSLGSAGVLCRYGGEEMIVFMPGTPIKRAQDVMEKIRGQVKKLVVKSGRKNLRVTISSGVAQRINRDQSIPAVIEAADKAVYKAKKSGRNKVCLGKIPVRRGKK